MNNDLLSGLFGALKEIDTSGKLQKELASIEALAGTLLQEQEKLKKTVSAEEYINWVYNTAITDGSIGTEYPAGEYSGVEEENRRLLHTFFEYLGDLALEQGLSVEEEECIEPPLTLEDRAFKIKGKYFAAYRSFDEPIQVTVALLDEPVDKCIVL